MKTVQNVISNLGKIALATAVVPLGLFAPMQVWYHDHNMVAYWPVVTAMSLLVTIPVSGIFLFHVLRWIKSNVIGESAGPVNINYPPLVILWRKRCFSVLMPGGLLFVLRVQGFIRPSYLSMYGDVSFLITVGTLAVLVLAYLALKYRSSPQA